MVVILQLSADATVKGKGEVYNTVLVFPPGIYLHAIENQYDASRITR